MSLVFLKLGGSLITDKTTPRALRRETLDRLVREIAEARAARPELKLLLGHGSGSFGHVEARKYGTRSGVRTDDEWRGFAEVQHVAGLLNRLVVDAAREAGLPLVNLPPSASVVCRDGVVQSFALEPVRAALDHNLIPLVFGDVALDAVRGGTIVSTEDVFRYLAVHLRPPRMLLAGIEPGVLTRWPDGDIIPEITVGAGEWAGEWAGARFAPAPTLNLDHVGGSHAADVTGGMASKVSEMRALVESMPDVTVRIFSGEAPGLVRAALLGEASPGTLICKR